MAEQFLIPAHIAGHRVLLHTRLDPFLEEEPVIHTVISASKLLVCAVHFLKIIDFLALRHAPISLCFLYLEL